MSWWAVGAIWGSVIFLVVRNARRRLRLRRYMRSRIRVTVKIPFEVFKRFEEDEVNK